MIHLYDSPGTVPIFNIQDVDINVKPPSINVAELGDAAGSVGSSTLSGSQGLTQKMGSTAIGI